MTDYASVARQLHMVRRAWKRASALSGLAAVVLESVGLFTLAFLVDVLYRPLPGVRVVLFATAVGAILYLVARHVAAPLGRRIPDQQLALYVEENDPRFEGSLIAAAEFRQGHWLSDQQAELVDAIIAEAALRAQRIDLRSVVDLSRLHKYGVAALVVVAAYLGVSIGFPKTVGHHAVRVLAPWEATEEDVARVQREAIENLPIEFTLSKGETALLRGTPFELEAVLSRASDEPVLLHFRPAADAQAKTRWRHLVMADAEKLNGFRAQLADVNEDMSFFVSTGEFESPTHRIAVYDPLVVQGVEVTTQYPSYMRLPNRVDVGVSGDVAAPIGSTVVVRVLTNCPLEGGTLAWDDGASQELRVDAARGTSAIASFVVEKDRSFTYRLLDANGQKGESPGPSYVRAIKDAPPTLELRYPTEALNLHPLGEVTFLADAADDFGVQGVDLVYMRGLEEKSQETRVPLALSKGEQASYTPGGSVRATLNFRLEDVTPRLKPEESVAFYLECRDRKGQKAVSDILLATVNHYESWATWESVPIEAETDQTRSLEPYFKAAWHLHTQKDKLAPADYARQSEELAASMINPETNQLYSFAYSHDPTKQEHVRRATDYVGKGHQALKDHDTGAAVDAFRVALAEIATLGLKETQIQEVPEGQFPPGTIASAQRQLEVAAIEAAKVEAELHLNAPAANAGDQARQAQQAADQANILENQQREIAQQARALAEQQAAEGQGQQPPDPNAAQQLAGRQDGVADQAKQVAENVQQNALAANNPNQREAAGRLERAATEMQRAARDMRQGNLQQAQLEAERAHQTLREAADQLAGIQQAKLERALDEAEARLDRLIDNQRQVRQGTETVARTLPAGGQPNARQQRDLRVAGADQVRLKSELGEVTQNIEQLRQWAEKGARPETAKHIDDASRNLRRGRVDQKMANAVVELAGQRAQNAAGEQREAEQGLERVAESVRAANDSLASDIESELRRARNEARRIEQGLAAVAPRPQPGEARPEATKQGDTKQGDTKQGEAAQPEAAPQASVRERTQEGERLAYDIRRLAKHIENRQFAPDQDVAELKAAVANPQAFAQQVATEEQKHEATFKVVRRIHDKLEEAYEAQIAAKTLFAAQREECPPQYRHLVNKYYEALSEGK